MNKEIIENIISAEIVSERIYIIRGKKVMIDRDLAVLYGVETKRLNEAVKRNIERFPGDFMYQLNKDETENLMSQIATSRHGGSRKHPLAFTEQGIAMLSSVLNSPRAIQVNIQIIRIFTKLREMVDVYKELREKIEEMENTNEANFKEIFRIIRSLIFEKKKHKAKIGFNTESA